MAHLMVQKMVQKMAHQNEQQMEPLMVLHSVRCFAMVFEMVLNLAGY